MKPWTRRETLKMALAVLATGCSSPVRLTAAPARPKPGDLSESNLDFAGRFYRELSAEQQSGGANLIVSPYSISRALAMTLVGARGTTAEQMQKVLGFDEPLSDVHRGFGELNRWFNRSDKPYELTVDNALWGEQAIEFDAKFLKTLRQQYDAELTQVDFQGRPESARAKINAAIEESTRGKIRDLLGSGSITSLTRLVLTNAIYFKGLWKYQFRPSNTEDAPFQLLDGQSVKVPMMQQTEDFDYAELMDGKVQLAALPYRGDELRMLILLPRDAGALAELERQISAARLSEWVSQMNSVELSLQLPRFKYEFSVSLKSTLEAMGIRDAFSPAADFSGMASVAAAQGFYISDAIHEAMIEVNEEGTEAAAATGVIVAARAVPRIVEFHCNRPFLFVIEDQQTRTPLMVGKVADPSK
ncbi:MAG: serpin family protein [Pirellulales bacterium]